MGQGRPRVPEGAGGRGGAGDAAPAPPIVVVMGVSGVGKSTIGAALAARMHWPYLDADSLHPLSNVNKMTSGVPLSDDDRWPWLAAVHHVMEEHRRTGRALVLACSALKASYCEVLVGDLSDVVFVCLTGPRELIADRLEQRRDHFMSPSLLASQLDLLEPPTGAITVEVVAPVPVTVSRIVQSLRALSGG